MQHIVVTPQRRLRLWFAIIALVATVAFCRADTAVSSPAAVPDFHGAIKSAYDQMTNAFIDNQLNQSAQFMTDDYSQVDPQGHTLDKGGSCKKFRWERNQIRTIESQCSIASMTVAPGGVQVEMATHSSGTGFKHVLFMNVSGKFTNDLRVIDFWVDTPSGWRLKYRKMLQDESHTSAG